MTLKQFEKKIKTLSSDSTLIPTLLSLYENNKAFKDIMSSALSEDDADKVFGKYKKKLERSFSDIESYSLQNCLEILEDYKSIAPDESYRAAMDYWFSHYAADLSATYGDFEDEFYDEIVQSSMRALSYADKDSSFFNDFRDNFERLIEVCGHFGFGVQDDISPVYERIWLKWDELGELKDSMVEE